MRVHPSLGISALGLPEMICLVSESTLGEAPGEASGIFPGSVKPPPSEVGCPHPALNVRNPSVNTVGSELRGGCKCEFHSQTRPGTSRHLSFLICKMGMGRPTCLVFQGFLHNNTEHLVPGLEPRKHPEGTGVHNLFFFFVHLSYN